MTERFYKFVAFINETAGVFWLFIISASLIFLFFILALILSLSIRDYSLSKRKWFVLSSTAVCVVQYAFTLNKADKIFVFLNIALLLIFSSIVFSVRVRKKIDKGQKELIDYIDRQVRNANAFKCKEYNTLDRPIYPTETNSEREEQMLESNAKMHMTTINLSEPKKDVVADLDFSHVKNVIARLNYYNLSQSDRKQVKDLENAILLAESNQISPDLKVKINDGLGMLLKIMSKYGA